MYSNMTLILKVVMVVVMVQAFTAVIVVVGNVLVGLIVAVVGVFKIIAPKNIIIIPIKVFFLTQAVLVVMHPNFQHTFVNPNFIAKLLNQIFISFLHLPSNPLCKLIHSLFLALAELCPKSLTRRRTNWRRNIYIRILIQTRYAAREC